MPTSKPLVVEAMRTAQADMKAFSDGSGIDSGIGVAAVLYRNGELKATLRKHLGSEDCHTVFEAEVVGLSLAAKLVRRERNVQSVVISADSQAANQATRNMKGRSGQHQVDRLHEGIERVQQAHQGLRVKLRWTHGTRAYQRTSRQTGM